MPKRRSRFNHVQREVEASFDRMAEEYLRAAANEMRATIPDVLPLTDDVIVQLTERGLELAEIHRQMEAGRLFYSDTKGFLNG